MRVFKIFSVGAVILCANALVLPANAQTPRTMTATVNNSINAAEMSRILTERAFSVVKGSNNELSVTTDTGFKFAVSLKACDLPNQPAGCLGVSMIASWDMNPSDKARVAPAIETFNDQYRIGKAMVMDDAIYAERYVITDGGVTLEHLGREVDEFLISAGLLQNIIAEAL